MLKMLVNAALFQVAWFAAVLGAAGGRTWLGPLVLLPVLAVNLAMTPERRGEVKLWVAAGMIGLLFDTALVSAGLFAPKRHLFPYPLSPPWMVGLWIGFAATLNQSLGWLHGRLLLAALLGAVGGPLTYLGGARLGAADALPQMAGLVILAVGWGLVTPLLLTLAKRLRS